MGFSEKILPNIMDYITLDMKTIKANELSHQGLSVPGIVVQYGNIFSKVKTMPFIGHHMIGSVISAKKSYKDLTNQPKDARTMITESDLSELRLLCKELGVDGIGYTTVDPSLIFKGKEILFSQAIVLTMEMKVPAIKVAPSLETNKEIFRTYYGLGIAVNKIADFLKEHGYKAEAGPSIGGEVNYPLLAQKAGMGYIGKHGLLITEDFGPSLRIAAVYTEIENLPIESNEEHEWIKDFCNKCGKCVRKCPAQAIYNDTMIFDDGTHQHIDYKKCAIPFSNNYGCTVCIKECIFFESDYNKIKERFLKTKV